MLTIWSFLNTEIQGRTGKFFVKNTKKMKASSEKATVRSEAGDFYQSTLVCSPRPHLQYRKLSQVSMSSDKQTQKMGKFSVYEFAINCLNLT